MSVRDVIKNSPWTFDVLQRVVVGLQYKPGWEFGLQEENGALRLVISDLRCVDAYNPGKPFPLSHLFPVPQATYNEATWRRFVYDCCVGVEIHEIGEWLRWGYFDSTDEDDRPFAPMHGPGENPYVVHEIRPEKDARTKQDGSVR